MRRIKTSIAATVVALFALSDAQAQFIGGGTPDMRNGARGIDQPSSNEGQVRVPAIADPEQSADTAPMPAPAPQVKAKKKVKAKHKKKKVVQAPPAAPQPQ
jgi:hypothetical protein